MLPKSVRHGWMHGDTLAVFRRNQAVQRLVPRDGGSSEYGAGRGCFRVSTSHVGDVFNALWVTDSKGLVLLVGLAVGELVQLSVLQAEPL